MQTSTRGPPGLSQAGADGPQRPRPQALRTGRMGYGIPARRPADRRQRVVLLEVVHQHHLVDYRPDLGRDLVQQAANVLALVVDGNDDRQIGAHIRHPLPKMFQMSMTSLPSIFRLLYCLCGMPMMMMSDRRISSSVETNSGSWM